MGDILNIGVTGAAGRMGRMVIAAIREDADCRLVGAVESAGNAAVGRDAGELAGLAASDIAVTEDAASLFAAADLVIDFTLPAATGAHAELAGATGTALVIGTTGLADAERDALAAAAERAPLLWAPNMSPAVNLLFALTRSAAASLPGADIEIVEMHHRRKIDAPSGTALALGAAAADGRGVNLEEVQRLSREGETGARPDGEIGFASLRGGDIAGEHTVILAMDGERIELSHLATDRMIFARGAVRAAKWLQGRAPGLYAMADMLDLDG